MPKNKKQLDNGYPHNYENEQALLGCIILDPKIQIEIVGNLKEDDFFDSSHKLIFNAISEILKANRTVDIITLTDMLEKQGNLKNIGDISYITGLTNILPSTANYVSYLSLVKRDSMLRRLIGGATGIIKECNGSKDEKNSLALAEKTVYDIANDADTSEIYKIGSVLPEVMTTLDELSRNASKFSGLKTDYRRLDYLLNGFHGSDLMILAARPAMGKTSLAMNFVVNIALSGKSCAVFSLEMSKEQLVQRMLCSLANVSMSTALKGKMQRAEWLKIAKAQEMLANTKIFIDESSVITPEEILSKCRRIKRKHGLDFVMIDYIQLMDSKSRRKEENRQQQVSEISRNLKILAKELNVPVLALSQLNRSVESEKRRPQLSDLRESGAIEQDADIVMFIHRPDKDATEKDFAEGKVQKGVAELIVAKHRNGATDTIKLFFRAECTKFENLNEDTGEPEEKDVAPVKSQKPSLDGTEELPPENADALSAPAGVKSVDDEIFGG